MVDATPTLKGSAAGPWPATQQVAATNPQLATELVARAVQMADAIPDDERRSEALAGIASKP